MTYFTKTFGRHFTIIYFPRKVDVQYDSNEGQRKKICVLDGENRIRGLPDIGRAI